MFGSSYVPISGKPYSVRKSGPFRRFAAKFFWDEENEIDTSDSFLEERGRSTTRQYASRRSVSLQERPDIRQLKELFDNRLDISVKEKSDVTKAELAQNERRVVVLKNIPGNVNVKTIISQVCCGPLERIVFRHQKTHSTMEVYFMRSDSAYKFLDYVVNTGFFVVNGLRVTGEWACESNTENISLGHHPVLSPFDKETVLYGSARRVLIFSKAVLKPVEETNWKGTPSPKTHFSPNFSMRHVQKDFAKYGDIVEMAPVVSGKLSFSIHFADVKSAIAAKSDLDHQGSIMNCKYFGWTVCYGKDPTDKPCLVL